MSVRCPRAVFATGIELDATLLAVALRGAGSRRIKLAIENLVVASYPILERRDLSRGHLSADAVDLISAAELCTPTVRPTPPS